MIAIKIPFLFYLLFILTFYFKLGNMKTNFKFEVDCRNGSKDMAFTSRTFAGDDLYALYPMLYHIRRS